MPRRLVILSLSAMLAACGSGDDPTSKEPEATTEAKAAATPQPALKRVSYMGVSALAPGDWERYKPDDKSINGLIYGPEDDNGSYGFFVSENNQNAADYIDLIILNPRNDGPMPMVRRRHKVKVPGIGTGIRMQTRYKKTPWQSRLFATSIDGLLIELSVTPGKHPEVEQRLEKIMSSVRRDGP